MYRLILIILLITNCTLPVRESEKPIVVTPDNEIGCFQFKGRERLNCNNQLLSQLEEIMNTETVKSTELKRERLNDSYIFTSTKYCLTDRVCIVVNREEYEPTVMARIKNNLFYYGSGIVTGVIVVLISI